MKLPEPPPPIEETIEVSSAFVTLRYANKQQMQAYARQAAEAMREACAAKCDTYNFGQAPSMIKRAIRALEIEE